MDEKTVEETTLPSRRSLLKYGPLGIAGTVGISGLAGAGAALLQNPASVQADPAVPTIVGTWQGKVTYTAGLTLPPFRAIYLFDGNGNAIVTSDVEHIPLLMSGMGFGRWKDLGSNKFGYTLAKLGFDLSNPLSSTVYQISSTLTLDETGNKFSASGTRQKVDLLGIPLLKITFTVEAERIPEPGAGKIPQMK
jgi:hypothetical protein